LDISSSRRNRIAIKQIRSKKYPLESHRIASHRIAHHTKAWNKYFTIEHKSIIQNIFCRFIFITKSLFIKLPCRLPATSFS